MKDSINLTEMPMAYTGAYRQAEVMPYSYESDPECQTHKQAGLYLQFVEGCGYDVYYMSATEAEALAQILLDKAAESRRSFRTKTPIA